MSIQFDVYYRYEDLTRVLHELADAYPELVRLSSIGKSHEGRDLWLLEVTNTATGVGKTKPALWVDGNIHSNEVSGSSVCLHLLHSLVTGYGSNADITRCLDTRVFYVCPRVGPDAAELFLADEPRFIRSSTRTPRGVDAGQEGGLTREDMDGDGRILTMRVPDPNGAWKVCPEEPRLIVQRDPAETGGRYYRLLWEGRIEDYDGWRIQLKKDSELLDLNRNFPGWEPGLRPASGPFPVSEPEVRAVADFITGHPNITGGVSFHTWGGSLLRPYRDRGEDAFPGNDLATYEKIGARGQELTGYTPMSAGDYFGRGSGGGGVQTTWLYDHLGVYAWTVELWNPYRRAGIDTFDHATWFKDHPLSDEIKLLKWSDTELDGKGYVDWYPFDHPQLGPVELGGWDWQHFVSNPPPALLEEEIAPFSDWLVWLLLISPRLDILHADATSVGPDLYRIRLITVNTGWLPTQVTDMAVRRGMVDGVVCEIAFPENVTLECGESCVKLGQLKGRSHRPRYLGTAMGLDPTSDRSKAEWIVRGPAGTKVNLTVRHPRAGTVSCSVKLPGANR